MTKVERVRQLSDRLLQAMADELLPDVAILALIDAGVRILRFNKPGLSTSDACKELGRVAEQIGRSEAGN